MTFGLNLVLYGYWGFPLDSTPIYYFFSSPASALASVSMWIVIGGVLVVLLLAVGVYLLMQRMEKKLNSLSALNHHRVWSTFLQVVLLGLLFIPIRGGIKVSTMNVGEAYFSKDMRLNHAAVNPVSV